MKEAIVILFALVAAIIDIRTKRIPNELIAAMFGGWILLLAWEFIFGLAGGTLLKLADSALGCLLGGGIFLTVYFVSRRGVGGGDVKFMAAAGLYLGLSNTIPAILYGTVLAAVTGLILIMLKKMTRKDKIPLAPFLLAGIVVAVILP